MNSSRVGTKLEFHLSLGVRRGEVYNAASSLRSAHPPALQSSATTTHTYSLGTRHVYGYVLILLCYSCLMWEIHVILVSLMRLPTFVLVNLKPGDTHTKTTEPTVKVTHHPLPFNLPSSIMPLSANLY